VNLGPLARSQRPPVSTPLRASDLRGLRVWPLWNPGFRRDRAAKLQRICGATKKKAAERSVSPSHSAAF
jgi:hypothetical protein